jgi:hypothetical protein
MVNVIFNDQQLVREALGTGLPSREKYPIA